MGMSAAPVARLLTPVTNPYLELFPVVTDDAGALLKLFETESPSRALRHCAWVLPLTTTPDTSVVAPPSRSLATVIICGRIKLLANRLSAGVLNEGLGKCALTELRMLFLSLATSPAMPVIPVPES